MSWLFSQALVEEFSQASCLETELCALSKSTPGPQAYSCDAKTTAIYSRSRFGMTCEPLMVDRGEELLSAFLAASLAKTSALQEGAMALRANAPGSGASSRGWFVKWSHELCAWKTAQCSLLEDSELYSETWPRSGSMRSGMCFQRPTLAPTICVSASGSLLPTLCAVDTGSYFNRSASAGAALRPTLGAMAKFNLFPTLTASCGDKGGWITPRKGREGGTLIEAISARMYPTLLSRDYRHPPAQSYADRSGTTKGDQLPFLAGGPLNPDWCEWFMGFPIGWTASSALETLRYHEWQQQHSPSLLGRLD